MLRWSCTDFDNILMTVTCFEKPEVSQDTGLGQALWPQGVQCRLAQERPSRAPHWGMGLEAPASPSKSRQL